MTNLRLCRRPLQLHPGSAQDRPGPVGEGGADQPDDRRRRRRPQLGHGRQRLLAAVKVRPILIFSFVTWPLLISVGGLFESISALGIS